MSLYLLILQSGWEGALYMAKKLLMNDNVGEDVIILCKNYSPNGQPFYLWQDKMIDWDNYELYINVDISNMTKQWQHILAISVDNVTTWTGTKLHLYGSPNLIRIQPINGVNNTIDINLATYDKQMMQIILNKNGVYIEEELVASIDSYHYLKTVINELKKSNVIIGSAIANDYSVCVYNLVCLRKYQG